MSDHTGVDGEGRGATPTGSGCRPADRAAARPAPAGFHPSRNFAERRLIGSDSITWYHPDDAIPMEIVIISGGIGYLKEGRWYTLTGKDTPGMPIEWPVTAWTPMLFAPKDEHPCPNRALYDIGQCCGGHCFGVDGPEDDLPAPGGEAAPADETGTGSAEGEHPVPAGQAPDQISDLKAENERLRPLAEAAIAFAKADALRCSTIHATNAELRRQQARGIFPPRVEAEHKAQDETREAFFAEMKRLIAIATPTQETSHVES